MPLPLLEYQLLHTASPTVTWLQQDAFHFANADWRGVQASSWESSEQSWDGGDPAWVNPTGGTSNAGLRADARRGYGRWFGPGALHLRPTELWVTGAASERVGHDDLARVASAVTLHATWQESNPGFIKVTGGNWHLLLQDALTGASLLNTTVARETLSYNLPALANHAILWMRLENATRSWALPPDYLAVRGFSTIPQRFQYVEGGANYVWDYEADVGRRPADHAQESLTGEVMWDEYEKLVKNGGLLHRGEWSQYISDGATDSASGSGGTSAAGSGPWSALRIAVGTVPFAVGANVFPAPGAVLQRLHDGTATATPFDPLACSVAAFEVMKVGDKAGAARLGGTIATRNGPATAYWHFHPVSGGGNDVNATLLGVSQDNYLPVCEASLYPTVSDLLELPDGTELVLSYATLYRYDPTAPDITQALPGLPTATQGHPGGRCLRTTEGTIKFFTEYFGGVGAPLGSDAFAQFYNTLRTLDPRSHATSGKGTVFHGHNAAEVCWGNFYGWVQDKSFGDPTAQQFLAYLQGGVWVAAGMAGFPASAYHWQRARRVYTAEGVRLLVSGKAAEGEGARWGVADGLDFREGALPFRPRRLTRVTLENGKERLYAVGRFVSKDANGAWLCDVPQSVIALTGAFKTVTLTWHDDEQGFCTLLSEAVAAGLDPAHMAPFLWWIEDANQPAGGYWLPKDAAPTDGRPYLQLNVDATHDELCYLLHNGPLPYDPTLWPTLKLPIYDDGGIGKDPILPQAGPENAQDALDAMPDDTRYVIVQRTVPANAAWDAVQISDASDRESGSPSTAGLRKLAAVMRQYPNVWLRCDSEAAPDDLESYNTLASWNRWKSLPRETFHTVEVCALIPPATFNSAGRVFVPVVEPRAVNQLPPAAPTATTALLSESGALLLTESGEIVVQDF